MLMHFLGAINVFVELRASYGCAIENVCGSARTVWIRTCRAAVVGLNVEGSKARIPHDLGIHRRLFRYW
jgi:hypothetical protein